MKLRVLSVTPFKEDRNYLDIKIRKTPGFFLRFFGCITREVTYRGGDTVWHELPNYERPGTLMESWLSDQYIKARLDKTIDYS